MAAGAVEDPDTPAGALRKRGNEPATVPVRYHFFVGAALLALAAVLLALVGVHARLTLDAAAFAFLAGGTLFVEGTAYWYLPSFAKRTVMARPIATFAGPVLLPLATLGELSGFAPVRDVALALALGHFAVTLFASALLGPRWRTGVPFWAAGPHREDDRAAAFVLALSLLVMIAVAADVALGAADVALAIAWPASLVLFALGATAHLLPRSRSRASWWPLVVLGALAGAAGIAILLGFPIEGARIGVALTLGFPLAALAIAPPGSAKAPGPRLREAGPQLLAAAIALTIGLALANALLPLDARDRLLVGTLVAVAVGLFLVGVSLLTLPVLFNQRPSARELPLIPIFAALGALASLAEPLLGYAPARIFLAVALLSWLRVLWPLRAPRRECPPDEPS